MIQKIGTNNQFKTNNKPVSFKAKLVVDDSLYKSIKETYDAIAKFRGETSEHFDAVNFTKTLKENFEKTTKKIEGSVHIFQDDYNEGISLVYKNTEGKTIFASIPSLTLFKQNRPNHEAILDSLDKNYKKIFKNTRLPAFNPFEKTNPTLFQKLYRFLVPPKKA